MHFSDIEEFLVLAGMLSVIQYMREHKKAGPILRMYHNCEFSIDYEWEFFMDALNHSVEFMSIQDIENAGCCEYFLADETMTEYYRLCKEYGRRHGYKFKDNPYVKKADDYVNECMNINAYGYSWKLSTGTQHKYASALHFYWYPDFFQTVSLIQAVLEAFDFYRKEIKVLKQELYGTNKSNRKELKAA